MPGVTAVKNWTLLPATAELEFPTAEWFDATAKSAKLFDVTAECLNADTGIAKLIVPGKRANL